jgi:hypothetical protein
MFFTFSLLACGNEKVETTPPQHTPTNPAPLAAETVQAYSTSPILKLLANQIIAPGDLLEPIDLQDILIFSEAPFEELTWTIVRAENLAVTKEAGMLKITPQDPTWVGTETFTIQVCNPSKLCASREISISVLDSSLNWVVHTHESGYVIMAGGIKIAVDTHIDTRYIHVPEEVQYAINNSLPPFNDIDLLLITHKAHEHFSSDHINNYLLDNPKTLVLGPREAVEEILVTAPEPENIKDRVYSIEIQEGESTSISLAGVQVEAFFLPMDIAEAYYQNYGYLFTLEDITFFHGGNFGNRNNPLEYLENYGFPDKGVDIAFIPFDLIRNGAHTDYIMDGFNPRYIVPSRTDSTFSITDDYGPHAILLLGNLTCQILTSDMFK